MLLKGDCLTLLPTVPDDSVHAIVTDPPYELGFMGKTWDATGIAYNVEVWRQCLRVLKPGGHLLAFGGSRTYHRLACAIEDAGFEIRDQIMWVYGSGFPKSLDVSKAIDKAEGHWRGKAGAIASNNSAMSGPNYERTPKGDPITDAAKQWQGWGTALKPAHEPIVLARKPLDGTVANNVLTHGVGALNIDGCRVGTDGGTSRGHRPSTHVSPSGAFTTGHDIKTLDASRWPANFIHDGSDEVLELFPADTKGSAARFFYCAKTSSAERNLGLDELPDRRQDEDDYERAGTTNPRNRSQKIRKNHHPTVKPLALIRYLIQLVTPPGGTILDPFLGSGTTAVAAQQLHHPWIGCEITADYWPIIEGRTKETPPL